MSALLDRLKKNSTIKESQTLSKSMFFNDKDQILTAIPAINIAFSGSMKGGFTSGLTVFAGPSKHFKTLFSLICAKAYLDRYPDAIMMFYDSEFGTPQAYFKSVGIDPARVLHIPIANIENLKFDVMKQINEISRGDKVIMVIDSVGNLASKKEVDDALDGKSVADMTRAKQLKSLFRMVTPELTIRDIPMIVVNHTYMEQGMYPKAIVSGGTGIYYSSDNIFIIGRSQEKDGAELLGYTFTMNVEKSRCVREKSKIPISVSFDGGMNKYSGLLDIALETGHVVKPKIGWFSKVDTNSGEIAGKSYRLKETNTSDFWESIFADPTFEEAINKMYRFESSSIVSDEELAEAYADSDED